METADSTSAGQIAQASFHVAELKCANFRSYTAADIAPSPTLNCIVGDNGTGKTNILDALHYLALCRSPQNLRDTRNIRHGESKFSIFGKFMLSADSSFTVSLGYTDGKNKEAQIDGEPLPRLADLIGRVPLIAAYPSDTYIIDDGGDLKRRFLNAAISQYDHQHLDDLLKYDRLLRQRNAHLKEGNSDNRLLDVLDAQLNQYAAPIFEARSSFCNTLRPLFQAFYAQLTNSQEEVDIIYRSQLQKGKLQELLQLERNNDRQFQYTTVGPHRDNLDFSLDGYPIRAEGSQGQRRSYMIALRLAQLQLLAQKRNMTPILLLDDLFDRLDTIRIARLIGIVQNPPFGQVFVTDTKTERLLEILDYDTNAVQLFNVSDGDISPLAI